jgi:cytochrome c peroxidase
MRSRIVVAFLFLAVAGCQKAGRYPALPAETKPHALQAAETTRHVPPEIGWRPTSEVSDIPITFVEASTNPTEWKQLKQFWNHLPGPVAGQPTLHLGQSPLSAAVGAAAAFHLEQIKIKVPLGLPDPTPFVLPSNPLTYGRWRLGQKLFFDVSWLDPAGKNRSCASCHKPESGFTEDWPVTEGGKRNTASLINCVYNKHQFWDGRAVHLEEVIQRQLADEEPRAKTEPPAISHVWPGVVGRLQRRGTYQEEFLRVFGVTSPTQDTIGKALACYMRTILSGDSVYDRAAQAAKGPDAASFTAALDKEALKRLGETDAAAAGITLHQGYQIFQKHCVACHPGPLFTDHDFLNIGVGESDVEWQVNLGKEFGRFVHVPMGLKELRLIGAYKTPTLRNLPRTAPYMHDGRFRELHQVVRYFNEQVRYNPYLAARLLDGPDRPRRLNLTEGEAAALTLFLRALDGTALDPILATPPK